jgi:hypothetical protein
VGTDILRGTVIGFRQPHSREAAHQIVFLRNEIAFAMRHHGPVPCAFQRERSAGMLSLPALVGSQVANNTLGDQRLRPTALPSQGCLLLE